MATLTGFTGSVNVQINWNASQLLDNLQTTVSAPGAYGINSSWSFGNGIGQAANVFYAIETLAGAGTGVIDLTNLVNPQSNLNVNFGYGFVVLLAVEFLTNRDGSAGSSGIQVGGAVANAFNGWWSAGATQSIDIGGVPLLMGGVGTTGKTVSASSRYVQIVNLDPTNEATVRITVYGVQNNF